MKQIFILNNMAHFEFTSDFFKEWTQRFLAIGNISLFHSNTHKYSIATGCMNAVTHKTPNLNRKCNIYECYVFISNKLLRLFLTIEVLVHFSKVIIIYLKFNASCNDLVCVYVCVLTNFWKHLQQCTWLSSLTVTVFAWFCRNFFLLSYLHGDTLLSELRQHAHCTTALILWKECLHIAHFSVSVTAH